VFALALCYEVNALIRLIVSKDVPMPCFARRISVWPIEREHADPFDRCALSMTCSSIGPD